MSTERVPVSVDVTLPREGVALFTVEGFLDVDTVPELRRHLSDQVSRGRYHLLLDLAAVSFMDSSGINALLQAREQTRSVGGSVRLISPTPTVRRILDLTGVNMAVPSSESVDAALAQVSEVTGRQ
ncbi:STAS domain-containing protein [Streptomyces sp. NPDC086783]|uniref:STAS domain-containing protein n=1 Tax=Streptomyces sp. NPDC086783 TaxID=3365758 RepID=UPI00381F6BCC